MRDFEERFAIRRGAAVLELRSDVQEPACGWCASPPKHPRSVPRRAGVGV